MSIFTSTHNVTNETPLPASVSYTAALGLLHNHTDFQSLQPLLTSNSLLTTSPPSNSYIITKTTSLSPLGTVPEYRCVTIAVPMGPFSSSVTTTSAFIDTEEGVTIVFKAPMGLYGVNVWKIVKSEGKEELVLREENELTGPRILMPFVLSTKRSSHEECGLAFANKLEKDAKK